MAPAKKIKPASEVPSSCMQCPTGSSVNPSKVGYTDPESGAEYSCQQVDEYFMHQTHDCGSTDNEIAMFESTCCESEPDEQPKDSTEQTESSIAMALVPSMASLVALCMV